MNQHFRIGMASPERLDAIDPCRRVMHVPRFFATL